MPKGTTQQIVEFAGEEYAFQSFDAKWNTREIADEPVTLVIATYCIVLGKYPNGGYAFSGDEIARMKAGH